MPPSENERLETAEVVVEVKALEKVILQKFGELEENAETMKGQLATMGEASNDVLAKHDALSTQYNELYDRLQVVEQKGAVLLETQAPATLGQDFLENDNVKSFMEGKSQSARMELKTAIINATGQNQPLVPSDRLGGIAAVPNRILSIRDVLSATPTSSNLVEFTRETAFTNNAGPQVSGSPEAYENVTKPESGITFSLQTAAVVTLAHFIPASKQVMEDSPSLASHIDGRLMYGLKLKEETQLLSGTGANHQLNGLITQATTWANESPNVTNEIDIVRSAMKQAHVGEYQPNFLVLNPQDWFDIEIRKVGAGDDRYVVGNPNNMLPHNLWGLPVVVTNSIASGTFLVGSSQGAEIKDREQAAVEISREDGNNFTKNMVTVLAEERLALVVYRTEAFITGSL